jgi:hypothetical protein
MPGAQVSTREGGDVVTATVSLRVHVIASWLPSFTVTAESVAALEPTANPP